jgi:hypothetical protein
MIFLDRLERKLRGIECRKSKRAKWPYLYSQSTVGDSPTKISRMASSGAMAGDKNTREQSSEYRFSKPEVRCARVWATVILPHSR